MRHRVVAAWMESFLGKLLIGTAAGVLVLLVAALGMMVLYTVGDPVADHLVDDELDRLAANQFVAARHAVATALTWGDGPERILRRHFQVVDVQLESGACDVLPEPKPLAYRAALRFPQIPLAVFPTLTAKAAAVPIPGTPLDTIWIAPSP